MDNKIINLLLIYNQALEEEISRLRLREATLEKICKQAIDELENSKKNLARELHDELGQAMTSILLQLKMLQHEQDIEVIRDRIGGLRYLTQHTIEDIRRLAMNLRPTVLENLGLIAALEWYIKEYVSYTGIAVEFIHPRIKEPFPSEIETTIYRAVQESLTNVVRHAEATQVTIILEINTDVMKLQIKDNGKGMNPCDLNRGLGLLGMEERIKLVKGEFELKSVLGQGTEININLPLL
ncbi:MAG: sensor histidine kinase [Syntrophomonadaceae bacterium]|nr:sensor histidine kinase [Syntrophomonadaceae bacterium]